MNAGLDPLHFLDCSLLHYNEHASLQEERMAGVGLLVGRVGVAVVPGGCLIQVEFERTLVMEAVIFIDDGPELLREAPLVLVVVEVLLNVGDIKEGSLERSIRHRINSRGNDYSQVAISVSQMRVLIQLRDWLVRELGLL